MGAEPVAADAPAVDGVVTLAHGGGGRATRQLLRTVVAAAFGEEVCRDDQARLNARPGRPALTTDAFVASPRTFPGGDIGSLSVYGTVNDLAVGGAEPAWLSCALILEEGLPLAELASVCRSMAAAAARCGVRVVTGDTKVVPRGQADGLYVATTGVGFIPDGVDLDQRHIRPGDVVVLNGDVGRHGACVAGRRQDFGLRHEIRSDCAPLHELCGAMVAAGGVRYLRDATRGGVASVANELAEASGCRLALDEAAIPVEGAVRALCELLGLSPLELACEGRLVGVVAPESADAVLAAMRGCEEGEGACVVGGVRSGGEPPVTLTTYLGVETVLAMPAGELLPRIC